MPDTPKFNYYYPELNYWFNKYITDYGQGNKDLPLHTYIPLPDIEYDENLISRNSIFELLFNNDFYSDSSSVVKLFNEYNVLHTSPHILRRLRVTGRHVQIFKTSLIGNYDFFDLEDETSDNSRMVNKLLEYRMTGSSTLNDVDLNNLDTTLSQLIYKYLNLMTNGIYNSLTTSETIQSEEYELLDNMFELYVYAEAHRMIKDWKKILNESIIEIKQNSISYEVDSDFIDEPIINITDKIPIDTDSIYLFKNGEKLTNNFYTTTLTSNNCTIALDIDNIVLRPYDTIIIKYLFEEILTT